MMVAHVAIRFFWLDLTNYKLDFTLKLKLLPCYHCLFAEDDFICVYLCVTVSMVIIVFNPTYQSNNIFPWLFFTQIGPCRLIACLYCVSVWRYFSKICGVNNYWTMQWNFNLITRFVWVLAHDNFILDTYILWTYFIIIIH